MFSKRALAAMVLFFAIGWAGASLAGDACSEPVMTRSGLVSGTTESQTQTCVWRGIPYAAPPLGDLRWKAPEPAESWPGVREATTWGGRCVQSGGLLGGSGAKGAGMSEDCLNLNIWRPKASGVYPVMFWVHGGGYYTGAGSDPGYWGDRLAEAGQVIVVTINYRLGLFGFMAHPGLRGEDAHNSTGGYGTLDQASALQWVHENIGNFGGDPDNITIFGQSAGGGSICTLVATPLTMGMFNRAIMQSGLCELSQDLEDGYDLTRRTMQTLGCEFDDLACMRALSADKIVDQAGGSLLEGFIYMPCHDDWILTGTPLAMIEAGNYNHVSFLAGTVLDEFGKALKLTPAYKYTTPKKFEERLQKSFDMPPEQAHRLASLYPLDQYDNRPVEAMGRMFGADAAMQCPTWRGLTAMADGGNQTWFYRFDYHGMRLGKYLGSFHTAELPFLFDAFNRPPGTMFYNSKDIPDEHELSRVMQGYWTNFAKTGDPNGPLLPGWKPFSTDDQNIQILNTTRVYNQPARVEQRCEFWGEYNDDFIPLANDLIRSLF